MNLGDGEAAEEACALEAAAEIYETLIKEGSASIQVFLNLAGLYWRCVDGGTWIECEQEFVLLADERLPIILDLAKGMFPESTRIAFWEKYIYWAYLGEDLSEKFCVNLLRDDPSALDPVVYLVCQVEGGTYRDEALILLCRARETKTFLNDYVVAVLDAALQWRR